MFPPPPPPPPILNLDSSSSCKPLSSKLNIKNSINVKKEPNDKNVNALLSQIRQGAKLKKVTQTNDRSAPIIQGATKTEKEPSPITPSMFKGGSGPLNLNFKSPQFGNNPINPITKSINNSTQSITNNLNKQLYNTLTPKSVPKTVLERPTTKPPPLPNKLLGINRRQSFESGQINNLKKFSTATVNEPNNFSKSTSNNNKPLPPPRNTNMNFSYATLKPTSSLSSTPTSTVRHKSTQNLSSINTFNYNYSHTISNSTLKTKANSITPVSIKNYPTTPRPLYGPPPPPPCNKTPGTVNGSLSQLVNSNNSTNNTNSDSNNSLNKLNTTNTSLHSYHSASCLQTPLTPAPPPPIPLSISPLSAPTPPPLPAPPSQIRKDFNSAQNLNSNNLTNKIVPVPLFKNLSRAIDLESRFCQSFKNIKDFPPPDPLTKLKKQYPSTRNNPAPKPPQNQGPNLSQFNNTSKPLLNF